jgi:LuxR family maltose regulon positive regulatory protein
MWRNVFRYVGPDRDGALRRCLDRFTDEEIAGCPPLALVAANRYLVTGAGNQAEHWASAATAGAARAPRGTRVAVAGGIAIMRAAIARDGIACMAEDAGRAYRLEPDGSPWRSVSRLIEGVACHLAADRIRARAYLEEGLRAAAVQAPFIHALCLAQLTLLALEEDDWESGAWLAARAKALVESAGVAELPSAALVFAVSAAVRAHSGHVEAATGDRRQASKLLAGLKDFAPWYDAEARIALARAALRLSDPVSARGLLAEAARALRQTPDAVVLGQWLDQVSAQADATESSSINSGWSLTTAELRVLQFLPSHLSFPSIAERLYVSPNTVKTHVRAIYRKFDASSREQAVETARHGGLLDLSGAT